ncbi:hypothetical protein K7I13_04215 [Brucepastera parasyntrophica]|uniref:hypothetical protein n=1 Tax=Brucepastera parasyntrophica TaxID=2880008 RepID=UPI00210CA96E|nr:hypothetical protein [Brucepastera parasyntrophica]ULQ60513.1 hypothetical protein K7I13_04215 [Brucepastera parasyntrophica]
MKKALTGILLISLCGMCMFAAGARDSSTFEGKLAVTDAQPYITTAKGETLYLPAPAFYQLAWENSIKVGDTIKAEGFQRKFQTPDGKEEKRFLCRQKFGSTARKLI